MTVIQLPIAEQRNTLWARLMNVTLSVFYAGLLSWILLVEIVPYWAYLLYDGTYTEAGFFKALAICAGLGFIAPVNRDARSMIVISLHYLFFIPSIVYSSFNHGSIDYYISISMLIASTYIISSMKFSNFGVTLFDQGGLLKFTIIVSYAFLLLQVYFGAFRNFSIDIESVYEFRRESAAGMPAIFGYIYSNIINVLIPLAIVISCTEESISFLR